MSSRTQLWPDCGVYLPKVLMHSCSQPWSGLWRTLTQGADELTHPAVIRTVAYTYPRCWWTHAPSRDPDCGVNLPKVLMHSCSQPWSGLWRTLTQGVDALMLAAEIRTVAYTYPRCWCTHAHSCDPDCGVHLPKVLMHSCSQPWSGLWRTLTQGVDALMLAAMIRTVALIVLLHEAGCMVQLSLI
jgi:hypothetical protein